MKEITVDVSPSFLSYYDDLPKEIRKKFKKQLAYLKENPKHRSLQIHQVEGTGLWEFYVDIGYRCIFEKEGSVYKLLYVGTHRLIDRI
jgi:mRNA-degrading endonuclease RelE of RelBE toxin-antitoxin system